MTVKHTAYLDAAPDEVARLLWSEGYNIANQKAREDVVSVDYKLIDETDERLNFDLHIRSYKRSKTGAIDRGVVEDSVTRYSFDKATRVLKWRHDGGQHGDRVRVSGVTAVSANGSGSRIDREVTIDIRIPLVGKTIAKLVEREFHKGLPRSQQLIERLLAEESA